jgi:hypothetical protein
MAADDPRAGCRGGDERRPTPARHSGTDDAALTFEEFSSAEHCLASVRDPSGAGRWILSTHAVEIRQ